MNPHYHKGKPQAPDANGIEAYWGLLQNLSADKKRELAKRLLESAKDKESDVPFDSLYGAWKGESAQELVDAIRSARTFTSSNEREPL